MPNRDMASFVPARLRSRATSLRVVRGSIATTPFRVVCGPTTTTPLPTMIHPSLAAADLRRPLTEWPPAPNSTLCLVQGSIGLHNERRRDFRRLHSLRVAGGRFDLYDLSCRSNCGASRTQLQKLGVDCRDFYRAAGTSAAVSVAELAR